jgi:SAM-dependent methyltransferase
MRMWIKKYFKAINNYEFCVQWVLDNSKGAYVRVLDYGCGVGEIVKKLKNADVDAFGCDIFYGGGDRYKLTDKLLLDEGTIQKMEGGLIPFESESFDFVINNQVMEHIENLDSVLSETYRVLKPGGKMLNLFPDSGVWREGHCGIPFLHWFPRGSWLRIYYAAIFRFFGLGYNKENKTVFQWSKDICEWLDKWTYYKTRKEIHATYYKYFCNIDQIEEYWLESRLGKKNKFLKIIPKFLQKSFVKKIGGMVFFVEKIG